MIMTGRYKVTGQFYTLQFLTVLLLRRKTGKSKKARNIREKQTVREPILIILFEIGCRTTFPKKQGAFCGESGAFLKNRVHFERMRCILGR